MSKSNTLIIGDIHSTFQSNRSRIEKTIEKYHPSHIVFLGDYVDTRDQNGQYAIQDQADELLDDLTRLRYWIQTNNTINQRITCLLGNHDWAYINKKSPTTRTIDWIADPVKTEFDKMNLQLCCRVNYVNSNHILKQYICSHAGFNKKWLRQFCPNKKLNDINLAFNRLYRNPSTHPNMLDIVSKYRGGFDSFSSPIWCDLSELFSNTPNLGQTLNGQIVGHTNVKKPINLFAATSRDDELWATDTSRTGKCGLLVLEENRPTPFAID